MYWILRNAFEWALPMNAYPSMPIPISSISPTSATGGFAPIPVCSSLTVLAPLRGADPYARYYEAPPRPRGEPEDEDVPWYLGPRPDDHAVRAGGVSARAHERADGSQGAPRGRGPRRPDGRLRVPLSRRAQPRQPRRGSRCARRPSDCDDLHRAAHGLALRARRSDGARRGDARRGTPADARDGRARRRRSAST